MHVSFEQTIALFSPSSAIALPEWKLCLDFFKKKKISVKYSPLITKKSEFFAGTPKQRYSQIKELLGTKILLAVRGGSTSVHLLPLLDKGKQDQQKIEDICFIGFSDVSILLNYAAEKGGWAIHSHVANTIRLASLKEQKLFFSRLSGNWNGPLAGENQKQLVCLKQGKTEGILMGGNLASIVSLVGSKWQVDFTNKILFLEDTNEAYYSIERLFSQLYYSGSLAKIKGLVLGHFLYPTPPQKQKEQKEQKEQQEQKQQEQKQKLNPQKILALIENLLPAKIPILANFPAGHGLQNAPLPIGAKVFLDAKKKEFITTDKRLC